MSGRSFLRPVDPTRLCPHAPIAQLVELRTFNPQVVGSSPTGGTARPPSGPLGPAGVSCTPRIHPAGMRVRIRHASRWQQRPVASSGPSPPLDEILVDHAESWLGVDGAEFSFLIAEEVTEGSCQPSLGSGHSVAAGGHGGRRSIVCSSRSPSGVVEVTASPCSMSGRFAVQSRLPDLPPTATPCSLISTSRAGAVSFTNASNCPRPR